MSNPEALGVRVGSAANKVLDARFPSGEDFHFAAALAPSFSEACGALADRSAALLARFSGWPAATLASAGAQAKLPFPEILDGLSCVLESHLGAADEALLAAERERTGGAAPPPPLPAAPQRHIAGLARPQDSFRVPVDNSAERPFVPPPPFGSEARSAGSLEHPLRDALLSLQPTARQLTTPPPTPALALHQTPCVLVDTVPALAELAAALADESEFAVDLEAHSFRSFQGFTCLLQLSTRSRDWLVDALALRHELRAHLAPLFADPSITKVMHGADSDVVWLQRDFGIYLAGLFDTQQAARLLALPQLGLAPLLKDIAGFAADKRFQLADWRLRPLSAPMLAYARCDTHYLLFVADVLKARLAAAPAPAPPPAGDCEPPLLRLPGMRAGGALEGLSRAETEALLYPPGAPQLGALPAAFSRSAAVCLRLYRKDAFSPGGASALARVAGRPLAPPALAVLDALLVWQDRAARAADESRAYVLARPLMLQLAEAAPDCRAAVAAACGREATFALAHAEQIAACIAAAKAAHAAAAPPPAQPQPQPVPMPIPVHTRFAEAGEAEAAEAAPPAKKAKARRVVVAAAPASGALGGALRLGGEL